MDNIRKKQITIHGIEIDCAKELLQPLDCDRMQTAVCKAVKTMYNLIYLLDRDEAVEILDSLRNRKPGKSVTPSVFI